MDGNEFIILNNVNSRADISRIADKLLVAVSEPFSGSKSGHKVHISIGISIYPDSTPQSDALIVAADNAMYYAKNHGKNRYHFNDKSCTAG